MNSSEVKSLRKADWQKIAKANKVKFDDDNVVRYLVEKVAENIGVDDSTQKTSELKKQVCSKLESMKFNFKTFTFSKKQKSKASKKKTKSKDSKKATKKEDKEALPNETPTENVDRKQFYMNQGMKINATFNPDQTADDIMQLVQFKAKQDGVDFIPHPDDKANIQEAEKEQEKEQEDLSSIEGLRKKCDELGLGYTEKHTVEDLTQLVSAMNGQAPIQNTPATTSGQNKPNPAARPVAQEQGAGIPAADPNGNSTPTPPVADETPSMLGANEDGQNEPKPIVRTTKEDLAIYRDSLMGVIKGHFRLLTLNQIKDLINRGGYPFSYTIETNKDDAKQIAVTLEMKGVKLRMPNKKDWINISG